METRSWLDLCYEALGVPAGLPSADRRRLAERLLLEKTEQPVDILGLGAAAAALDLVERHAEAGRLDDMVLRWEAEHLGREIDYMGDEGTRRATKCAKTLVYDLASWTGTSSGAKSPGG